MPPRTVAQERNLIFDSHPQEAFSWLVDDFVFKSSGSTERAVAEENKLLVQKIDRVTFTSEVWEIHNFLVALLVFAENFNLSSGREDECYCWSTHVCVGSLEQAKTKGKNGNRLPIAHKQQCPMGYLVIFSKTVGGFGLGRYEYWNIQSGISGMTFF